MEGIGERDAGLKGLGGEGGGEGDGDGGGDGSGDGGGEGEEDGRASFVGLLEGMVCYKYAR